MSGGPRGTPPPLDLKAVEARLEVGAQDGNDLAALLAHARALESKLVAVRAGIPRWYEVDQGGEIFGWKLPDEHGCCRVVPAPREVEAFTAAVLAAAQDGPA